MAFFQESAFSRELVQEGVLVFKLGFQTPPNGCLDQLDTILGLGAALFLHPINKSTWSVTVPEFYILLQSILLDVISITRMWYIWQKINQTFQARIIKLIQTKHDINP